MIGAGSRAAVIVAALCAIGFIVLAAVVGSGPLPIDVTIRAALHVGIPVPPAIDILNTIGGVLAWDAGVAVLAGALFVTHRRIEAVWLAGGVLAGETLATVTKLLVDRPRPPGVASTDLLTQASFPSGHVTRTAITVTLLVLLMPGGRSARIMAAVTALAFVVAMGLARIASGEHWPTDVVGGYLLAGFVLSSVEATLPTTRAALRGANLGALSRST